MTLMESIQLVVSSYASFIEQMQLLVTEQAKTPTPELNYTINIFAGILQNQSIASMLLCAEEVRSRQRDWNLQATSARLHVTSLIDDLLESFKKQIREENNIQTILDYKSHVRTFVTSHEAQLQEATKVILDLLEEIKDKLSLDHAEKMYDLSVYIEMMDNLEAIQKTAENDNHAEIIVSIIQQYLKKLLATYDKNLKACTVIDVPFEFDQKIKNKLSFDKIKWPTINREECGPILEALQKFAQRVFVAQEDIEEDYYTKPAKVRLVIEKYNTFLGVVRQMLLKFSEENDLVWSLQEELNKQVLAQAPLIKDARRRAIEYYNDNAQQYRLMRDKTYVNLQNCDEFILQLQLEYDKSIEGAKQIYKAVQARFAIAKREFDLTNEFLAFIRKDYSEVAGEYFQKIKEKILLIGDTSKMLKKIKRYAVRYPSKATEIKKFNQGIHEQKSLHGLIKFLEYSSQNNILMDHAYSIAKFFRIRSGIAKAINNLISGVTAVVDQERKDYALHRSLKAAIRTEKQSLFPSSRIVRFDFVKKRLLQTVDQCSYEQPQIDKLKSEIFDISCWNNLNSAKISRLMREVMHTAAYLASSSDVAGKTAFKVLQTFYRETKQDLGYREEDFKFSTSYQKLKAYLLPIKTFRSASDLWSELDQIAESVESEGEKYELMRQTVLNFYYKIRQSKHGSAGSFFGHGSRLGDGLEKFLTHPNGLNVDKYLVPHRINSSVYVPNLLNAERDVLWVKFKL